MRKPHIFYTGVQWMVYRRKIKIFGTSMQVAFGPTVKDAWAKWISKGYYK